MNNIGPGATRRDDILEITVGDGHVIRQLRLRIWTLPGTDGPQFCAAAELTATGIEMLHPGDYRFALALAWLDVPRAPVEPLPEPELIRAVWQEPMPWQEPSAAPEWCPQATRAAR